ncbi:MAG: ATP-dependent sacrificial sulfur transferase LarE [Bacteroidales bacterium]|jgi:uncharacterized protein
MKNDLPVKIRSKLEQAESLLAEMGSVAVAYSGGVDSTLLLYMAGTVLGDKAVAVYADSPLQPAREKLEVQTITKELGIKLIAFEIAELGHDAFISNPPNRCYYCKSLIFKKICDLAKENQLAFVVDGSNHDDRSDFRPGARALQEMEVRSPFQEAGLTKEEIRKISRHFNLPTWDKDALACLATRIPFGETITESKLRMIDKAEEVLVKKGFRNVRARFFGDTVKIEVRHDQVKRFTDKDLYNEVFASMRSIGFQKMHIDPKGYRMGNMNER